ncbi:hypothetical protein [Streptomyces sp. CBMA156]|uniref:hypothetical protein n=1 Tax=Streptomyces sp. CBMA156 TaxID=1930280 RepID=UPI001661F8D6|nr:hypothetical protein [Streptomyces sp. CBMA156]
MDDDLTPPPGHTARLDQLTAVVRDRIGTASARLRQDPGTETVAALLAELRAAGLDG